MITTCQSELRPFFNFIVLQVSGGQTTHIFSRGDYGV